MRFAGNSKTEEYQCTTDQMLSDVTIRENKTYRQRARYLVIINVQYKNSKLIAGACQENITRLLYLPGLYGAIILLCCNRAFTNSLSKNLPRWNDVLCSVII